MSEELSVEASAEMFAEMAAALHDESTFDDTVERVLEYVLKAIDCTHAGILFVHKKTSVDTVAATHSVVAGLDRVQVEIGKGPDLDLINDPYRSVIVPDSRTEERWPEWAQAVADAGIRSMLGTRLHTSTTTIGSLNLYDVHPRRFTPQDAEVAHVLARHAAVALSSARQSENLWKAIDARQLIGQSQGILMERFGIDADSAFAVLRRYSQDHNIKLHDVAEKLVSTRRLPE